MHSITICTLNKNDDSLYTYALDEQLFRDNIVSLGDMYADDGSFNYEINELPFLCFVLDDLEEEVNKIKSAPRVVRTVVTGTPEDITSFCNTDKYDDDVIALIIPESLPKPEADKLLQAITSKYKNAKIFRYFSPDYEVKAIMFACYDEYDERLYFYRISAFSDLVVNKLYNVPENLLEKKVYSLTDMCLDGSIAKYLQGGWKAVLLDRYHERLLVTLEHVMLETGILDPEDVSINYHKYYQ